MKAVTLSMFVLENRPRGLGWEGIQGTPNSAAWLLLPSSKGSQDSPENHGRTGVYFLLHSLACYRDDNVSSDKAQVFLSLPERNDGAKSQ